MTAPPRILVIYAHPAHDHSHVNYRLAEAARSVPNVRLHDLYETYPDFYIDVAHEQALLSDADLVVLQHPIQWYSMPSLLKEWIDVVLEHGWAYGAGGIALRGKDHWLVCTTGGTDESYQESGQHEHPFSAFLPPFEQTARLCGMRWLSPYIIHGARQMDDTEAATHAAHYRERLASYPNWSLHWPEAGAAAAHTRPAQAGTDWTAHEGS